MSAPERIPPASSPPGAASPAHETPARPDAATVQKTKNCWERLSDWFSRLATDWGAADRLRDRIEVARVVKLHEALDIGLVGRERGKKGSAGSIKSVKYTDIEYWAARLQRRLERETGMRSPNHTRSCCREFVDRVIGLHYQIEMLHESKVNGKDYSKHLKFDTVEKIRAEISDLLGDPIYQTLKDKDSTLINFLQILSRKLYSADARPAIRQYARELRLVDSEHHSLEDLEPAISKRLDMFNAHKRDGKIRSLFWGIFNKKSVEQSVKSGRDPLGYNGHINNPSFVGHDFTREIDGRKKKIQFVWGPGMTGDRIVEQGLLPAYKKFNTFELRFNYQDTKVKHEFKRIQQGFEITSKEGYEDRIKHVLLGFETKAKLKALKKVASVGQFLEAYRDHVMRGARSVPETHQQGTSSGVYIPNELLSDREIGEIISGAGKLFASMGMDEALNDRFKYDVFDYRLNGHRRAIVKTMFVALDGMISAAIIHKQFEDPRVKFEDEIDPTIDEDLQTNIVTAACKQGIDRGPVQANIMRIFYRAIQEEAAVDLSEDEFAEIAGSLVGRAQIVEGRNILMKKYKPFKRLMQSTDPGNLGYALKDLRPRLSVGSAAVSA